MKGEKVMKKQICIGLVLFAIFIFMGISPYQAQGVNNHEDYLALPASTSSPASAPWFRETVYSYLDVGQHVSLALDPADDRPYISFYDANYEGLRMAKYVGSGGNCGSNNDWECELVDQVGNVGQYSSIAIAADGLPIIAYYDATNGGNGGALKLAVRTVFDWDIKTIHDPLFGSAGQYASLAVSSNVRTGIAYYYSNFVGNDSLWYAEYVGGSSGTCTNTSYDCEQINYGDQVGKYTSLALDSADRPHIAYYDNQNDALKYATYDGGWFYRWIRSGVSGHPAGKFTSIAVDVNNGDRPHIAHYDSVNGTLEYAVFVGDGADGNCGMNSYNQWEWKCEEIDSMGTATHPRGISLALDGAGYPIIAYQTGGSGLKIARPALALGQLIGNCGPADPFYTWQCDVISIGFGIGQADYLSLAVNSAGLSTIAYYGNSTEFDGDLRIARQRLQVFLPLILK
jgi:hypothetical protein